MKKLNILVIPSWYPNKKDPLWGNYFIKQSEALNECANVSMLYINRVGLKEASEIINEKMSDGFNNSKYSFDFYKKSILNLKGLSLDLSYKKYVSAGYKAYKKMKKELGNFDIVLVESILPAGLIAREIFKKDNIPYIVHAHSKEVMTNKIYKKYIDLVMKDAKSYMGVSKEIVDIVKEKRKDCFLVPNFIDCSKFDIKRKINKDKFILTSISNFYKVKKIDVLLKALDIVINKGFKNIHLNIIGTGEYKYYYESICNSLNLNEYVTFIGYVDNKDIPAYLSRTNILCVSSSFETFCIPIIEAFSMGVPVITTDCGGPSHLVDKTRGVVVPIDDIEKYADGIIKMINNYDKYNSDKIKKYAFSNYDKSVICKKIIDICNEAIEK
jgi:L-malate glycosyltransferase